MSASPASIWVFTLQVNQLPNLPNGQNTRSNPARPTPFTPASFNVLSKRSKCEFIRKILHHRIKSVGGRTNIIPFLLNANCPRKSPVDVPRFVVTFDGSPTLELMNSLSQCGIELRRFQASNTSSVSSSSSSASTTWGRVGPSKYVGPSGIHDALIKAGIAGKVSLTPYTNGRALLKWSVSTNETALLSLLPLSLFHATRREDLIFERPSPQHAACSKCWSRGHSKMDCKLSARCPACLEAFHGESPCALTFTNVEQDGNNLLQRVCPICKKLVAHSADRCPEYRRCRWDTWKPPQPNVPRNISQSALQINNEVHEEKSNAALPLLSSLLPHPPAETPWLTAARKGRKVVAPSSSSSSTLRQITPLQNGAAQPIRNVRHDASAALRVSPPVVASTRSLQDQSRVTPATNLQSSRPNSTTGSMPDSVLNSLQTVLSALADNVGRLTQQITSMQARLTLQDTSIASLHTAVAALQSALNQVDSARALAKRSRVVEEQSMVRRVLQRSSSHVAEPAYTGPRRPSEVPSNVASPPDPSTSSSDSSESSSSDVRLVSTDLASTSSPSTPSSNSSAGTAPMDAMQP